MKYMHRLLALGWLLLLLMAAAFLLVQAKDRSLLETDIYRFLPDVEEQADAKATEAHFSRRRSQQMVVLLTSSDTRQLTEGATALGEQLQQAGHWRMNTISGGGTDPAAIWHWYGAFPKVLLSDTDRHLLSTPNYEGFLREVTLGYINPVAMSGALLKQDPLLLRQHFLASNQSAVSGVRIVEGWPLLVRGDAYGLILPFSTDKDVYSLEDNQQLVDELNLAVSGVKASFPDLALYTTGPLLHIHHSVEQSEREVSRVGVGSLLGILLIFIVWLRSPLPLLSSVLVLGAGLLAAFSVMIAVFGSVHLIALVFASTVLGIGIDYALHYFAHRSHSDSGLAAVRSILLPTGLGMATSALAFLALSWVPFPGFQQVAWMAALGLVGVWISVMLWLPYLSGPVRAQNPFVRINTQWLKNIFHSLPVRICALLLALAIGAGILALQPNDDVRQLQATFPPLKAAELELQNWLNQKIETAYFLVQGESEEQVLSRMEALCAALRAGDAPRVQNAQCLSDWLPSLQRQRENALALQGLAKDGEPVWQGLTELGLDPEVLAVYRQHLQSERGFITPEQFWQGPLSGRWNFLWLSEAGHSPAAVVTLSGIRDHAHLQTLATTLPGVHWVDEVGRFSHLFGQFRQQGGLFVMVSYGVLLLLLALRYGWHGAVGILWPVLAALWAVLGMLGWLQLPFNLFSVLALILVAGMGIDYGIFMREASQHSASTLTAVIMSALTTLLAFGLLALSETTAISSFGVVILIGISVVLLCTLLSQSSIKKEGCQ